VRLHVERPERRKQQDDDRATSDAKPTDRTSTSASGSRRRSSRSRTACAPTHTRRARSRWEADRLDRSLATGHGLHGLRRRRARLLRLAPLGPAGPRRLRLSRRLQAGTSSPTPARGRSLRQKFIEALRGIQRLAAHLIGFDGAYLRFSGKLEPRHYEERELTETSRRAGALGAHALREGRPRPGLATVRTGYTGNSLDRGPG
jgi:hypothetical protein